MPALSPDLLAKMDAYWRAANYLSVGQIYLQDNPLLERPLERKHIKARLLGQTASRSRGPGARTKCRSRNSKVPSMSSSSKIG
jgi:phosphoketolase